MITLLSPSKTLKMDEAVPAFAAAGTQPHFLRDAETLVSIMRDYSAEEIQQLMKVSEKIAALNVERFATFQTPFTAENATPALYAFKGDVYEGLDAPNMSEAAVHFANTHLRVLSGLYGLLRPLDYMQAYRLEMGRSVATERGKNLYQFWGERIAQRINEEAAASGASHIINLASGEYFKAVPEKSLEKPLITIHFKEKKGDDYKVVGIHAKKARGKMARTICDEQITNPAALIAYDRDGYGYAANMSDEKNMVFTR